MFILMFLLSLAILGLLLCCMMLCFHDLGLNIDVLCHADIITGHC